MGFFDFLKKRKKSLLKTENEYEYRNDYEVKVELLYAYPEIFDSDKINENLNKFFDDYFSTNSLNEYEYKGMWMSFSKAFMTDSCVVKIIFDEVKIEFLDELELKYFKKKINNLTGVPEDAISVIYMTADEKFLERDRKVKAIEAMKKFSSAMNETNAKAQELIKKLEREREERKRKWKFSMIYSNIIDRYYGGAHGSH